MLHRIKVEGKSGDLDKEKQLAWAIAKLAKQSVDLGVDTDVLDMVKNRLIDNAAIALAAANELPVVVARSKALSSEGTGSATIYGFDTNRGFAPEKAAFANAVAVRYLDQDDTYLAAEYSHPDDNISPLLAIAQNKRISGADLIRGIIVAYEIHVALVGTGNGTGISLHKHKVDHMTHIAAASSAGIGAMLGLTEDQIYNSVNFAVHNSVSSRQSRKGKIGAQKEFVPGFSAEISIDAVNSAMYGLLGPNPIYEGVDSLIAQFLDGPDAEYMVELWSSGEGNLRNIMKTYPKEHSFEYQGQAIIDLALDIRPQVESKGGIENIEKILLNTSHHTHHVIGTGANDPEKTDLTSPRGTLDHSIMFAIGRSLESGEWHHERSYLGISDNKPLSDLVRKIETAFDDKWEHRYHSTDPEEQAFGGDITVYFKDGSTINREKAVANAHVYGDNPWGRAAYIRKFDSLTSDKVDNQDRTKFIEHVERMDRLTGPELMNLTLAIADIKSADGNIQGIYSS